MLNIQVEKWEASTHIPWWLSGKESACNAGDLGSIPGLGQSPGGGHGNPHHYSYLENLHGQRNLAVYSPWGRKESDTTERLSTTQLLFSIIICRLTALLVFMKDCRQILYSWHILQWESWGLNDLFKCRWRLYSAHLDCSCMLHIADFRLALLCVHFQLLCILSGNFTVHCLDWFGNQNPIWENKPNKNDNGEIVSKGQ